MRKDVLPWKKTEKYSFLFSVSLFIVYYFQLHFHSFLSLRCKNNVLFTAVNCKFYETWGRDSDVRTWPYKS